jgi:hypothetical protein
VARVQVLVNNLVETTQERSNIDALGRYRVDQLVRLRDGTVGMIVRLSANNAHVLMPGARLLRLLCSSCVPPPFGRSCIAAARCRR